MAKNKTVFAGLMNDHSYLAGDKLISHEDECIQEIEVDSDSGDCDDNDNDIRELDATVKLLIAQLLVLPAERRKNVLANVFTDISSHVIP